LFSILPDWAKNLGSAFFSDRVSNPPKSESPVWKEFDSYRGSIKTNGESGKNRQYYEWDYTHNDIEVYDKSGNHLGSMNPVTGDIYKSPVICRDIKDKIK
jgi:hypothetical protein